MIVTVAIVSSRFKNSTASKFEKKKLGPPETFIIYLLNIADQASSWVKTFSMLQVLRFVDLFRFVTHYGHIRLRVY